MVLVFQFAKKEAPSQKYDAIISTMDFEFFIMKGREISSWHSGKAYLSSYNYFLFIRYIERIPTINHLVIRLENIYIK